MQRIRGRKADILAWTNPDEIEGVALEQLKNISSLPWVFHHVAAMPDVHYGKGATVGSVIAMKGAVSPAAVGVDVGCGVGAVKTSLTAKDLPDDLRAWRSALERAIPVGFHEDRDLAVFLSGTREMDEYRRDLFWAQRYAMKNREAMLDLHGSVLRQFRPEVRFAEPVLCHHNYVAEETHFGEEVLVTRKGAIRAGKGDLGVIPGSMGTRSFVVRGLGNAQSFESASHGAGRRMSRGEAKRRFSVKDLEAQTKGVECRKDPGVLDEIPGAYKLIEQVMENQKDLVEVVAELRQVLCVKG